MSINLNIRNTLLLWNFGNAADQRFGPNGEEPMKASMGEIA